MLNSKAVTKVQSIILIAIIAFAAVGGSAVYILQDQTSDAIKIGFLGDLDGVNGKKGWHGAILATEQINAEGGILGRQVELIGEDHDFETSQDMLKVSYALTRLITYHKVDFILGQVDGEAGFISQDIVAEHKKILLAFTGFSDELTQRVLDNYDKYKYYFKVWTMNATASFQGMIDSLLLVRELTGFNKIGYISEDLMWADGITDGLDYFLPEVHGFDLVYKGTCPLGTFDFSSYFAAAETAGVEILIPLFMYTDAIPFAKEYYDRQSPLLVYGGVIVTVSSPNSWEWTDGKCEHIITPAFSHAIGYPLTTKTLPTAEAYSERWSEGAPNAMAASTYDIIRFILPNAIERAGTIETDSVIEALEDTKIETSMARKFVFTESHDVMIGENPNNPEEDFMLVLLAQWQDGNQVPVYPRKLMEEAGVTYTFPDWPGPWDNIS